MMVPFAGEVAVRAAVPAIPNAVNLIAAQLPGQCAAVVAWADGTDDVGAVKDAHARLSAIETYIAKTSTEGRGIVAAAMARLVVRIGALLGPPGAGRGGDRRSPDQVAPVQIDLPAHMAADARKMAEHPDIVEAVIAKSTDAKPATRQAVMLAINAHARESTPASPSAHAIEPEWVSGDGRARVLCGDSFTRLQALPDASVDLIVTDPPYPNDALPMWSDLAKLAAAKLGPRGILFAWSGQLKLDEVMERLGEHLTYGWMFALQLPGSGSRIMGRHMIQGWKPVLAYTTGTWPSGEWADDVLVSPAREKDGYWWQQNGAPARRLIERFSANDGLIVDPFLGVGSFGAAAIACGRRFVGCELDEARFNKAVDRLAEMRPA